MPELPEVQILSQQLKTRLNGLTIRHVHIFREELLTCEKAVFKLGIENQTISDVRRIGKFIHCLLQSGDSLWFHLGMTGRIYVEDIARKENLSHVHLVLEFHHSGIKLIFQDSRRFGRIGYSTGVFPNFIRSLGPDALDLSEKDFVHLFKLRTGRIKSLLLNQKFIAGLGNIYADESLYRAAIRPDQRAFRVTKRKLAALCSRIKEVLSEAIQAGGSSIDDFFHTDGQAGKFQNLHQVYGRHGMACLLCGAKIRRKVLAGRSSHFCPVCQK